MSIIAKNTSNSNITIGGVVISANGQYSLQKSDMSSWAESSTLVEKIGAGDIVINDGLTDLDKATGINLVQGSYSKVIETKPFTTKYIGDKSLFTRVHGISQSVSTGSNNIDFSIPYNHVKFNALEIVNPSSGDYVDLKILDDSNGTYSGVANYQLNQFGYAVNLPNIFYTRSSSYDADLYINMVIRLIYNSSDNKTLKINFVLHELK